MSEPPLTRSLSIGEEPEDWLEAWELPATRRVMLHPLGRQDNEDLDCLIVAADAGLLRLTCLLFNSEWFWDSLIDSWTDYLMSPFEDYPLNSDAQ